MNVKETRNDQLKLLFLQPQSMLWSPMLIIMNNTQEGNAFVDHEWKITNLVINVLIKSLTYAKTLWKWILRKLISTGLTELVKMKMKKIWDYQKSYWLVWRSTPRNTLAIRSLRRKSLPDTYSTECTETSWDGFVYQGFGQWVNIQDRDNKTRFLSSQYSTFDTTKSLTRCNWNNDK